MKKITLSAICLCWGLISLAGIRYTLVQSAKTSNYSSTIWSPAGYPTNGDTILIPVNKVLTINTAGTIPFSNVVIYIQGQLAFATNDVSLALTNSTVYLNAGGKITGSNKTQDISMNNQTIYTGKTRQLNGPLMANASTNGFIFYNEVLPVKFTSFTVSLKNTEAYIQWSTAQEMNASLFQIEKSADGTVWNTIANIKASGNSNTPVAYSFTDKNAAGKIVYYRIKQVDVAGQFVYTGIKSIKTQMAETIKMATANNRLAVLFSQQVNGPVQVQLISLQGQVLNVHTYNEPASRIEVTTGTLKGAYIVRVTTQESALARQVIL